MLSEHQLSFLCDLQAPCSHFRERAGKVLPSYCQGGGWGTFKRHDWLAVGPRLQLVLLALQQAQGHLEVSSVF